MEYLITGGDYLKKFPDFCLVGRDEELSTLSAILIRSHARSVILSGARGVGCEHLCIGIQASKKDPNAPLDIVSKRLFWLDANGLFSSGEASQINSEFQKIMRRLEHTIDAVLIIDDARDFLESARNSGCSHFVNSIVSAVWHESTQVIMIAGDDELEGVLRAHNDFRELFTIMTIEEPIGETLKAIVSDAADQLVKHHKIKCEPDAVAAAIELTNKYHTRDEGLSSAQPERAITLIDRAFSSYRLDAHQKAPQGVTETQWTDYQKTLRNSRADRAGGEDQIVALEEELARIQGEQPDGALGADTADIAAIRAKIRTYQKSVNESRAEFDNVTEIINQHLCITRDIITAEFSEISGIPLQKLNQNDLDKLKGLEAALKRRVFGQDYAIKRLTDAVRRAKAGRRSQGEPQASFLFLGSSGVGKTEMAKALASVMLDDERALTRFDMSEYMEKHAVAKLIGAPPGYEGFEAGGILTNLMRKNGNRILLFDEIEKAHDDIYNIFLQILSDGRLSDNLGRTVSFEDSIILMTTNIGQSNFLDKTVSFEVAKQRAFDELSVRYRPELLNRFEGRQNIICFNRLEIDSIERIVRREIAKLNAAYEERGITISIDDATLKALCVDLDDPVAGARKLPGFIKAQIEPVIVDRLIDHPGSNAGFQIFYNLVEGKHRLIITDEMPQAAAA